MKRTLRFFALSIASLSLLASCSVNLNATNPGTVSNANSAVSSEENEQGLAFYLQDDGTYGVGIGNAFRLSEVTVPPKYKGRAVTTVIRRGFCTDPYYGETYRVKKVFLPETITTIESRAFNDIMEPIELFLPRSLTFVGEYAFNSVSSLTYSGTMEEFERIDLDEGWYSGLKEIHFSDKEGQLEDFCTEMEVSFNNFAVSGDKVTVPLMPGRSGFYCLIKGEQLGGLSFEVMPESFVAEDPSVIRLVALPGGMGGSVEALKAGTTKATFSYKTLSCTLTFEVVDS